jgi:hypothetical protein
MYQRLQKLGDPYFLFSLVFLILNDWIFKYSFHNTITGKLSDFAGLFAFPFLISALFPKQIKGIHICTFLFFIFWKSEFSQPYINLINYKIVLIDRVIDYSDYVALISIPLSYFYFNQNKKFNLKPIFSHIILVVSCIAFSATSSPRHIFAPNKKYEFNFSKKELVQRFNKVQKDKLNKEYNKNWYYYDSTTHFYNRTYANLPLFKVEDYATLSDNDSIYIKDFNSKVHLQGNDSSSSLILIWVTTMNSKRTIAKTKKCAIKKFQKNFIKNLKTVKEF